MNDTEKLLASYDCGTTGGWLQDDLECGIDGEPWCALHMYKDEAQRLRSELLWYKTQLAIVIELAEAVLARE